MAPRGGLHLVRDEVTRLERVRHPAGAHADPVAHADGAKLVADEVRLGQRGLDALAQAQEMAVASERGGQLGRAGV